MASLDNIADRIARAVVAAEEADRARTVRPRADRAWLVEEAAARYGLGDALAARITGEGPTEIQRSARDLALTRDTIAAAEAEAKNATDPATDDD
ncbi:hypothetical protein ABZV78_31145 [Micromonospora sp. NPDC004540]|uniref:hypothetical protein n=1 Tax=Micromonospora sp. NPDC004540 TaxID=3154457 RepID=UPI0033BAB816